MTKQEQLDARFASGGMTREEYDLACGLLAAAEDAQMDITFTSPAAAGEQTGDEDYDEAA
jgi:hypothetical protein